MRHRLQRFAAILLPVDRKGRFSAHLLILLAILTSIVGGTIITFAAPKHQAQNGAVSLVGATRATTIQKNNNAPTPFMYRPYYGSQSIGQRTVSFVDHDQPWYSNDGTFVRYDGAKWTHVSIGSCTGGVNCYDGHNGYDLNLRFEPVVSAAAGTVIRAGWYNPLDHNSSLGLWIAIDHGNGYYTAYGHLSALTVSTGQQVGTQWQIGTSGTTGSSTGPHLHMATYYAGSWSVTDPFGWSGNYPDPNVVPDNYLWVSNPGTNNTIPDLSSNGSSVYPGATLIDDGAAGWSSSGTWNSAKSGSDIAGNLHWTPTTTGSATATATWQPQLSADGYYEVGVFIDDNNASSSWAPYTIYSADPNHPGATVSHTVYVDQTHIGSFQGPYSWENTGPQWIGLGTYYFSSTANGHVVVSNATGENGAQLAADGMEFVPVSVQPPPPLKTYGFSVVSDGTPSAMLPNVTTSINVTLKNTGNFIWSASGADLVQVIYRWLNTQNQVIATGTPASLPQDVAAGASVSLSVPVQTPAQAATYTLQWDMIQDATPFSQHGAQVKNDSVSVVRYAEKFSPLSLPTTLTPGATVQVHVDIQNTGAMTWPASGSNSVTLGYAWLDSNGHVVSPAPGDALWQAGILPGDVLPGGTASIPLTLHAPALAGSYSLVLDCQQQSVWFASQGATPLTARVTITPRLPRTYYFAEGYTGSGTTEYLTLTNPSAVQATITITYLYSSSPANTRTYSVSAQSVRVLSINREVGANKSVSMIVQGNQPFAAERTMYTQKGSFVAATAGMGSSVLSTSWYFAEGNTTYGWNTLLSVMNPSAQPARLTVTSLPGGHTPSQSKTYTIPAHLRSTIILNSAFRGQQFGLVISASVALLVERDEYLVTSKMRGGSSVIGATAPQKAWYFGAGNTTPGFIERLVLANPEASAASAWLNYLTTDGRVVTQNVVVPARSRVEVNVNSALGQALHATTITASIPIIAERQDFFDYQGSLLGSTTSMSSNNAHTSWYIARGDTSSGHMEALAVANPNAAAAIFQVVYYVATGQPVVKTYTLTAHTRMTINLADDVGVNKTVGVAVYATVPLVVEQAVFFNVNGATGGYASMGLGS